MGDAPKPISSSGSRAVGVAPADGEERLTEVAGTRIDAGPVAQDTVLTRFQGGLGPDALPETLHRLRARLGHQDVVDPLSDLVERPEARGQDVAAFTQGHPGRGFGGEAALALLHFRHHGRHVGVEAV
ncbi:MAG: hypothetical protein GY720_17310, partial [bacterium]|nr:hypothetical protein [bacterium]